MVTFLAEKATFRRRDDDIETQLEIAVSPEDDVEVRRLAVTNHSDRPREIEVTSYAEIVLAPPADDLAHPAFGKLFVETEYLPESAALLCRRRPRAADETDALGGARAEPRGPAAGRRSSGRPTARASWAAAAAPTTRRRSTGGRSRARPASCSIPSSACGSASASRRAASCGCRFATGMAACAGDGARPGPEVPRPQRGGAHLRARLHPRAERAAPPRASRSEEALLFERLASRVLLRRRLAARAARRSSRATRSARTGSGRTASRATCRSCSCASWRRTTCRSCARSCRRRSTGGSRA